ncbi:flagellar protein FlaG [Glaciecola sp. MH2013]|uniref:flagellar protein FlaG n=1 Tax=Glaciecola sp. MH2013 TaxID=2785524 RepID=UPI00189F3F5A|nr:flagellar protein FlaG [Glaciecola sp. MH2013]MBF7072348.1 flagellar protein FlaG [Glaciecola sp. MH2013]
MDTINPQAGNNVASQFSKASALPQLESLARAQNNDVLTTAESVAAKETSSSDVVSLLDNVQSTKANPREADTLQREESVVEIERALGDISEFMQNRNTQLAFSIDEATDKRVVTVKDASSGDVIRQIPSEEVLKFAERVNELQSEFGSSAGILLQGQA